MSACGGCLRCHTLWAITKEHPISHGNYGYIFPLCEGCWQVTSPEEKKAYVIGLIQEMRNDFGKDNLNGQPWDDVIKTALESIDKEYLVIPK